MSLVGRIVVIFLALIISMIVAGIVLVFGVLAPEWPTFDSDPVERIAFFLASFFATGLAIATAFAPAVLLIILSEALRMRRLLYYAVAGVAVGLAAYSGSDIGLRLENTTDVAPVVHPLQLAAAAGIVGGLFYWLVAGRNAGRWREG
jgi:uncharacterized membrane protein YgdD (TMEM256/DUF423 family)